MNLKYSILSLALLLSGAMYAMEMLDLDLGAEDTYTELTVAGTLSQKPHADNKNSLKRFYTLSNARLHSNNALNQCELNAHDYTATIEFSSISTHDQVVVVYELKERPWLPLLFNPTTIESGDCFLYPDKHTYKTERLTANNELVTLSIVATWTQHTIPNINITPDSDDDGE